MAQARETHPHIVEAAQRSPQEFATVMREFSRQAYQAQLQRERAEAELAAADEFDVDAQRKIEEAIQQENVYRSFENAMEFSPESFGTVTMLYVQTEVNGHEVKAFVDSGAQATISEYLFGKSCIYPIVSVAHRVNLLHCPSPVSPECAERCGILRLIDRRFAGIARGVGTAKILGRVHSAQIKLSNNLYLPCSFTIMEGKGVECLFGLDMLKRYQANIDLKANALVINGESLRFLDEHELPSSAKELGAPEEDEAEAASRSKADAASSSGLGGQSASSSMAASKGPGFPGAGQILNPEPSSSNPRPSAPVSSAPSAASGSGPSASAPAPTAPQPSSRTFPPEAIDSLVNLGASRVQAQALLEAAGGNVEVAAGLLFHGQ